MTDLRNGIDVHGMLRELWERREEVPDQFRAHLQWLTEKKTLAVGDYAFIRLRHGELPKGVNDMATKTKSKSAARPKGVIPCKFGKISIGVDVISLPVRIERSALGLDSADNMFAQMRSNATLLCDPNASEDAEGQQKFDEQEIELDAIVECHRFGVSEHGYSASLNMNKKEVEDSLADLVKFAARTGSVQLTKPQKIEKPKKAAKDKDGETTDEE